MGKRSVGWAVVGTRSIIALGSIIALVGKVVSLGGNVVSMGGKVVALSGWINISLVSRRTRRRGIGLQETKGLRFGLGGLESVAGRGCCGTK